MAGGRSSRFGRNKLLTPFKGKLLIESVVAKLKEFPEVLLITKTPNLYFHLTEQFRNLRVVQEPFSDYSPIYGVYTALRISTYRKVLVLPGDVPLVKEELIKAFSNQIPPAVLRDRDYIHSLFALLLKDHIIFVEEFLKSGSHRLKDLHRLINSQEVPFSKLEPLDYKRLSTLNVNRQEDYYEALYR